MGGKALKNTPLRRITAAEYAALSTRVLSIVGKYYRRAEIPSALHGKPDFGDLDVVVAGPTGQTFPNPTALPNTFGKLPPATHFLALEFRSKEVVHNGPVTSFELDEFQIDIVQATLENIDFAVAWMAWGDVGNIVGVVANRMGLMFGFDGLGMRVLSNRHVTRIGQVTLTQKFPEALKFLGYDYERWRKGFVGQEDAFEFLVSGAHFEPEMFLRENLSRNSKERSHKRPMFENFLKYVGGRFSMESEVAERSSKLESGDGNESAQDRLENLTPLQTTHRLRALEFFGKRAAYDLIIERDVVQANIKQRFLPAVENIRKVKALEQRPLGQFIASYKASKASVQIDEEELPRASGIASEVINSLGNWEKWVLSRTDERSIVRDMEEYYESMK
ncbi:hypothetical protein BC938DRAFT_473351 [Jimgerdemannia flammicorona]|uniref:Uncharacterized protein n=1 Tax=Jimgerdemannia flammicorona TaxID=994334 RepID=A0A433QTC7_9FUNG|nr:hypothetical protein BC938DRAFT_473351 [Jimgerdemannia flammicorona]